MHLSVGLLAIAASGIIATPTTLAEYIDSLGPYTGPNPLPEATPRAVPDPARRDSSSIAPLLTNPGVFDYIAPTDPLTQASPLAARDAPQQAAGAHRARNNISPGTFGYVVPVVPVPLTTPLAERDAARHEAQHHARAINPGVFDYIEPIISQPIVSPLAAREARRRESSLGARVLNSGAFGYIEPIQGLEPIPVATPLAI